MDNKYALIDLYKERKENEIINYYDNKIELESKNSKILKEYNNIISTATEELQKLYMSQFNEEELEILNNGGSVEPKELYKTNKEIAVYTDLDINCSFENKKCIEYKEAKFNELNSLYNLYETVEANLAIASNKDEVEEILRKYEILDKDGKMEI